MKNFVKTLLCFLPLMSVLFIGSILCGKSSLFVFYR